MWIMSANERRFESVGDSEGLELCLVREYENNGIAAFVKVRKGSKVPSHTHVGDEECYVIEGRIDVGDGRIAAAGDYVLANEDDEHELIALEDTLFFVTIHKGFVWTHE